MRVLAKLICNVCGARCEADAVEDRDVNYVEVGDVPDPQEWTDANDEFVGPCEHDDYDVDEVEALDDEPYYDEERWYKYEGGWR